MPHHQYPVSSFSWDPQTLKSLSSLTRGVETGFQGNQSPNVQVQPLVGPSGPKYLLHHPRKRDPSLGLGPPSL